MIAGTFVLEDQSIQFHLTQSGLIEYTVHDATSGVAATKAVGRAEFSAAVHMALLGDDDASECMYELATGAMPTAYNVNISDDEVLEDSVLQALRWIP